MYKIPIQQKTHLPLGSRLSIWEIQKEYPKVNIRLEYPVDKMDIDIVVFCGENNKQMIPIELKWLRTKFECCINGEKFQLALSGADAEVRYDCLKDIERIENISEIRDNFVEGYTIWISNIETHFTGEHKYMQFDISQDKTTETDGIDWRRDDEHKIINLTKDTLKNVEESRKKAIELKDSYTFHWEDYSIIDKSEIKEKTYYKQNKFKYCITTIKKPS